ncbi:probable aspartic proteinase GIP2 [Diospyros lotus]|uniref:probable aspartic proteinase GIP2 n=1 Tax=Diospyros lotus TaxID=55363 RepID=UPI002250ACD7|nr:probable aspartic proteinase GIP2 [Diospyros lotus]
MAASTSHRLLLLLFSLLFLSSAAIAAASFRPRALVLRIIKDEYSLQHYTYLAPRTPFIAVKVTLDLGGQFLWVDCDKDYNSSSFRRVTCGSALCKLSGSRACGGNTCVLSPDNTVTGTGTSGDFAQDALTIQSTDGANHTELVSVRRFPFTCGSTFLLKGLADGALGMAGLGRTAISMPSQLSAAFSFPRKFAVCLSPSLHDSGVVFFGDGPYILLPKNIDVSKPLLHTPLIRNPVSTASGYFEGEPSSDYFIGVKSIKINGQKVPLNQTLLSINKKTGYGGTKISTVKPYTVMQTSIYNAVTQAFIKHLGGVSRVKAVAPFKACFSSKGIGSTRAGPAVPAIDLVLQSESVYWRIFGANSMVRVNENVMCLGFVDGGENPRTSIVIGAHQIEDNLLQFDLAASKLGFSSSLLLKETNCGSFNFTPKHPY